MPAVAQESRDIAEAGAEEQAIEAAARRAGKVVDASRPIVVAKRAADLEVRGCILAALRAQLYIPPADQIQISSFETILTA